MSVSDEIFSACMKSGFTKEAACALLANLQAESALKPNNLEDTKNRSLGMTDEEYTAAVDNGSYRNFVNDSAGYGLAQWTYWSRKQNLFAIAKGQMKSIGDLGMQIDFLFKEMREDYPSIFNAMKSSHDLEYLVHELLWKWENPDEKENNMKTRMAYAQGWYQKYSGWSGDSGENAKESSGMTVEQAKEKVLNLARAEIGYHEQGDNWTKYAQDLDRTNWYNGPKNGFAWCFTAGTLILTNYGYKNIEDIQIGDKVLNATGTDFNDIIAISNHEADVMGVRVYGCLPFLVTPDHPFLAEKRINKWHRNAGYENRGFYPISELELQDTVAFPKSPVLCNSFLSYDDYWTLGYYVGDGYYSNGRYKLSANDNKIIEVEKHADGRREAMYSSRTCIEYELHCKGHEQLFENLQYCGSDALNKTVPPIVLYGDLEAKKAFLDGYLTADGCASFRSFNTVSKTLVAGITRILYDLGIPCYVNIQERPEEGCIFDIRKNDYRYFKQQPIIYNCGMNTNPDRSHQLHTEYEKCNMVPIREKSELLHRDIVYTLSTNGDSTYTANNIGVHNCDVFVDWLFWKCFGDPLGREMICQPTGSAGAGCLYSVQYYQGAGRWYPSNPQPGDQIFFTYSPGEYSHTGIVESVQNGIVTTIEGNTSDQVARRQYTIGSSNIAGYGRPRWELAAGAQPGPDPTPTPSPSPSGFDRILKKGMHGDDVRRMQEMLITLGYGKLLEPDGADGDFGNNTYNAVVQFQMENGLFVDGEAGPDTLGKMQELANAENQQEPAEQNQNGSELPKNEDMIPEIGVKMIRNGDKGNMVKLAQSCLSCLGFSVSINGIFGNEFEKKIRQFQTDKSLESDGIVGEETWKQLLNIPYMK